MSSTTPKITVLGSINMDLVIRCARLPQPGETVIADDSAEVAGGKGANQAVAASRLGARVSLIGRVGRDAFADRLLENLEAEGVDVTSVRRCEHGSSGLAVVAVEASGENAILVVPGANAYLSAADVEDSATVLQSCDVLLLQLEIPVATVLAAKQWAMRMGKRVILNPAPAPSSPLDESLLKELLDVDLLCPNRSEACALLGHPVDSIENAQLAVQELLRLGPRHVVITLGGDGAVVGDHRSVDWVRPFPIVPVDTTAAGDAFVGALAVRWCEGAAFRDAVRFGCAAGAIAATRRGAQPGMPHRPDVVRLLDATEQPQPPANAS